MNESNLLVVQQLIEYKFNIAIDEHGVLDLDKCCDVLLTQGWETYCHLKIKKANKVVASPIVVERLIDNVPTYFDGVNLEIKNE